MTEKIDIKEEDNVQEKWYVEAKIQTLETLPEFCDKLANGYSHDYGTICHALTAAAIGAATAMDNSKQGGITGFQAGYIGWEFIKNWNGLTGPAKIIKFSDLLYPQYESRFNTISEDTWNWLKKEAVKELDNPGMMSDDVATHMRSIVNGVVPFGLKVVDKDDKPVQTNLHKSTKLKKYKGPNPDGLDGLRISRAFDQCVPNPCILSSISDIILKELLDPDWVSKDCNRFLELKEDAWKWLQYEAKLQIEYCNGPITKCLLSHWYSIVNGTAPFGLKVVDKEGNEISTTEIPFENDSGDEIRARTENTTQEEKDRTQKILSDKFKNSGGYPEPEAIRTKGLGENIKFVKNKE